MTSRIFELPRRAFSLLQFGRALAASAVLFSTSIQATHAEQANLAADDPAQYIQFVLEDEANCQIRDGQHISVRSSHPTRTIRVWLDRFYQNTGTGDRSHSDLAPAAEPEGLGCSVVMNGKQEWRIVRAQFLN